MSPKRAIFVTAIVCAGAAVTGGFLFRTPTPRARDARDRNAELPHEKVQATTPTSHPSTTFTEPPPLSEWEKAAAITTERSGAAPDPNPVSAQPVPRGMQPPFPSTGGKPGTPTDERQARMVEQIGRDPLLAPYLAASRKLHLDEDSQTKLLGLLAANSHPPPFAHSAPAAPAALDTPESIRAHMETQQRLSPSLRELLGPSKASELLTMATVERLQHGARLSSWPRQR